MKEHAVFKNLFNKSSQRRKKPAVVYKEYRSLLRDKLIPVGFNVREGSGLGNFSIFKRENLEISLEFELRENETSINVKSGRKVKFKTVLDQLTQSIQNKTANLQEAEEMSVDKADISLTLTGMEEEKISFMKRLDGWLAEHS
jgi:hypothetical protein